MKNKIRIYELAKELDLKSKFVVEFLNDLGADVSNHMSSIDEDIANMLREHFAPEEEETPVSYTHLDVYKRQGQDNQ